MRSRLFGAWGIFVCAGLATCCAARGPSPLLVAELGAAKSLVSQGCYRCLQEALTTYERLAASPNGPIEEAQRGAVQVAVLLAVRARELGLPDGVFIDRARSLASRRPPVRKVSGTKPTPAEPSLPLEAYVEALPLIGGETSGYSPEEREKRSRDRSSHWPKDGSLPAARTALAPQLAHDIAAQYLALAIDCEDARARKQLAPTEVLARHNVPLIRYRLALCAYAPDEFTALRTSDARWLDTFFFDGRREMSKRPVPDVGKGAEHFQVAHDEFRDSTAISLALANARNALSEFEPALALFDQVLATFPTHRDALLGRVMSLSYLSRHYEAINSATRLLDLGTYHIGDAYYWRAWNRYNIHELESAWDDVERATKLMVNTSVYTLAGFIAYARRDLDVAVDRFAEAYRLDRTNCEAHYTEGLVHTDKASWDMGAQRFATSIGCYANAAAQAERERAALEQANASAAAKARKLATLQKQIDTAIHRRAQAAFNAASCYARLGQKGEALGHIDVAAEHPLLKEKALALKTQIEKLP